MNRPELLPNFTPPADAGAAPAADAAVGTGRPHESAHLHVAGAAPYTDDLPELAGTLHGALGLSPLAHGVIESLDLDRVRSLPGVVAVIGHLNSGVSIETAPIYAAKDIAQIAISTNPKFTQLGFPTTFRMVANDTLQARAIGSFAATQLGAARYAALDDGTPYGKGLADGAAEQLKAEKKEVVVRKSFDDKTVAFDELAGELKAAKVEVIVSTLNDFQALALLEALRKVDHTKVSLLGGDTIKTTDMTKAMGMVEGVYATSPVLEAKEFTTGKPFLEKYIEAYKKPPAYGGHYSYDSTYVLSAAIQKAKSADPKAITKAMHSINGYAPVIGTMTWDDKGEQRYGAVGVYELRSGSWELRMRSDRW